MKLWEYLVKNFGFNNEAHVVESMDSGYPLVILNGFYANNPNVELTTGDEISVTKRYRAPMVGW